MTPESQQLTRSTLTIVRLASLIIWLGGLGAGITTARAYPFLLSNQAYVPISIFSGLFVLIGGAIIQQKLKRAA